MTDAPGGREPPEPARPHEPTLTSQPMPAPVADQTRTVTGAAAVFPSPVLPQAAPAPRGGTGAVAGPSQVIRHGPGVPSVRAGHAQPTAEQVWRTALPNEPRPPRRLRRLAGPALSVALLAASGAVMYLRLHHGPFGVTGVAITQEVKSGCTEDVTGRVSTTGAAGTVSYQWVFEPQLTAPRPLSESVASGQDALYVTAAVEGQGHGTLRQTVTLQVLGPGQRSVSARVTLSC